MDKWVLTFCNPSRNSAFISRLLLHIGDSAVPSVSLASGCAIPTGRIDNRIFEQIKMQNALREHITRD